MKNVKRSVVFEVDGIEKVVAVKVDAFSKQVFDEAWSSAFKELTSRGYQTITPSSDYGNTLYYGYGSLNGEPSVNDWWLKFSNKPNCYVFEGI